MEKLAKDIFQIINTDVKNLNGKVKGLNFLELLKANILEKLFELISKQDFPLENFLNYENEIQHDSRNIKISINYFLNSLFETKKTISNDSLFFSFNENTSLDIFDYKKKSTSILLYKNTGISLPKDTVINKQCNKNLLLIEIINKEKEQILTK
mgnify:CR=1 FL=1